ncbi:MAG: IS110 family transposase [Gammaproteobacteria bacterium]|nr:IS110 family transposase [Gammaproteobacteria bacterium]
MQSTTIAVDLAKNVIEVAIADSRGHIVRRDRLGRSAFAELLATAPGCCVVMEACGGAHFWGRRALAAGHTVRLLPAQYVRPYRRRNKTDRADCSAILQASRDAEIRPVAVKTVDQQAIQALHRLRSGWQQTRIARINAVRGLLRELGGGGAGRRYSLQIVGTEIRALETCIADVENRLATLTRHDPAVQCLQQISGVGLLTSTALVASAVDPQHFKNGRHLASWLGLTPRACSSGQRRTLGRISKRGDVYTRMLLIHGARSVLLRAGQLARGGKPLNGLQRWALDLKARVGHNKAAVGLANKLARIAWACWHDGTDFDPDQAVAVA